MLTQGCDTTCSINRIGKQTAYSKVVTNIGMLSQLTTFHKDNLDDSVDVARNYALLLYGKKGEKAVLQSLQFVSFKIELISFY